MIISCCAVGGDNAWKNVANALPPILFAAQHGSLEVIQFVVEQVGVKLSGVKAGGLNLAHFACTFGHARLGEWAVSVEPSLLGDADTTSNSTPLHVCASKGDLAVLDRLLPNATVDDLAARMVIGSGPTAVYLTPLELAQVLMLRERGSQSKQAVVRSLLHYTLVHGHTFPYAPYSSRYYPKPQDNLNNARSTFKTDDAATHLLGRHSVGTCQFSYATQQSAQLFCHRPQLPACGYS